MFTLAGVALAQPAPGLSPAPAAAPAPTTTAPAGSAALMTPPPAVAPAAPAAPPLDLAPAPATTMPVLAQPAVASPGAASIELSTLRLLRDKGVISQAEFDGALHDMADTAGLHAGNEGTAVLGKWSTTLYGFVESDFIGDSTRAFNDLAGSALVPRGGSEGGDNGRVQFGIRNSRFGLRMKAPETSGIRASAQFEFDFQGTQLPVANPDPSPVPVNPAGSESAFFTSPVLRVRHLNLKLETPIVDILAGQYWTLFGWGSSYQPGTVEIQGVPGEVYARTPQLRISKTLKAYPLTVEVAIAATRPVQRDGALPDGQGGLRLAIDSWTGVQTVGSTGTQISPASIAVSGLVRRVAVDQLSTGPKYTNDLTLGAVAVDAFIPVIPGSKDDKNGAFSLNGEFASGYGFSDMYTGLTGGISFPALPPTATNTAPPYAADIDNGVVTYDGAGKLHGVQWTTYLFGAQFYLPGTDGKVFVTGNMSHAMSANTHYYGNPTKLLASEDWFDANLFVDPIPSVRIGAEYANFHDTYVDGQRAINHRAQLSGFFIF